MFRKLIAPIIITIIIVLYFSAYILGITGITDSLGIKIPVIFVSMVCIGYIIFALVDRIEEIRSGEEDDLSKY